MWPRNMCSAKEVITALRMTPSKIGGNGLYNGHPKQICDSLLSGDDAGFSVTCYESQLITTYDRRPIVPYVFSITVHVIIEKT